MKAFLHPIYLDYAAGTPIMESVLQAGIGAVREHYYHPEALYAGATATAQLLTDCRSDLGELLAVKAQNLHFAPGASAANALIIQTLRQAYPQARLAALNIDHDSIKLKVDYLLPVAVSTGYIEVESLLQIPPDICCLSLAGINNEVGVLQPFAAIKKALMTVRQQRLKAGNKLPLLLHIDASQMALTHNLQPQALADADLLTLNAAKFYGFKQSALLYVKSGINLEGMLQNDLLAPSNQSLMLALGLREALTYVTKQRSEQTTRLLNLRNWFESQLQQLGAEIVLLKSHRATNLMSVIFPGHDNESLVFKLSQAGIYIGIGSACHSQVNSWQASVLRHLGYNQSAIYNSLRFSFGYETDMPQLQKTLATLKNCLSN